MDGNSGPRRPIYPVRIVPLAALDPHTFTDEATR